MTTAAAPGAPARPLSMWLRLAGLAAAPPIVWALARWDFLPHLSLCMFQNVTGLPCPGCGMTRAMLRLSQGDVLGSLRMHPLGVPLAALFAAALYGTAAGLVRGDDPVSRFLERRGFALFGWMVVLFVVSWVVRAFIVPEWGPGPVR